MQLFMIGVHQRTAPIAIRERLAFSAARTREALDALRPVVVENPNYALFRRPSDILLARFFRVSAQFDF